ncbi:beta strand repeat-containing protein [Iningainema tapete]|uniref:S-layer family protein n=1 Tax=Iningainema tapete BLCC-T55 TaxID=2748662 RepID=A0A8J6XEP0_9CYAN|nr:S-layer family protein [Iningainema tapete]MBD2772358.1 S-layer family protein [Iningainema tapete BLCC-T55]
MRPQKNTYFSPTQAQRRHNWLHLLACSTVLFMSTSASAQIVPDQTLGAESSRFTPNVTNCACPDSIAGGARRGNNLFHSFSQFNISNGQKVYFVNPSGVQNILTRVTGGQASNIFGTLGVEGTANLFLINPNGILFGPNARLDVRNSFVGTTANAIRFGEQGIFSATNPEAPPLLTIKPSALLYTQISNANITNQASIKAFSALDGGLTVPEGKSLLLVGGNVIMDGGKISVWSGRIELGGLAGIGTVSLNPETFELGFPANVPLADVILNRGRVASNNGGKLNINAGNIKIANNSQLFISTKDGLDAQMNLQAQNLIDIENSALTNSEPRLYAIDSQNAGKLDGGDVHIQARSLLVRDGVGVRTGSYGTGRGGNMMITTTDAVEVFGARPGGQTGLGTPTNGPGRAGDLIINTPRLSIRQGGIVASSALGGTGRAGDVTVNADTVEVNGTVFFPNVSQLYLSILRSETFTNGDAGNLTINTRRLSLQDGGLVSTRAFANSKGRGGNLTINASEAIEVVGISPYNRFVVSLLTAQTDSFGDAGNLTINTPRLSIRDGAVVSTLADSRSSGRGGTLTVNASESVEVNGTSFLDGSSSRLSSSTSGKNNAGNLTINTPQLRVSNSAQITASTDSQARGGNITLNNLQKLQLDKNSLITARSTKNGQAGNLQIDAQTVNLQGQSGLSVEATQEGRAGNLVMNTRYLNVTEGSRVSVSSPQGRAGQLDITANVVKLNQGKLTAETGEQGAEITLRDLNFLLLRNGSQINASANNYAQGGNITINADLIIAVPKENSDITANAYSGTGGRVQINTQGIFGIQSRSQSTDNSDITASSTLGVAGVVNIYLPDPITLQNSLTQLPTNIIDANALIANSCISRRNHQSSSTFFITGSAGLPERPGDAPLSPYPTGTIRSIPTEGNIASITTLTSLSRTQKNLQPIVEAQGIYRLANGDLVLSRECP